MMLIYSRKSILIFQLSVLSLGCGWGRSTLKLISTWNLPKTAKLIDNPVNDARRSKTCSSERGHASPISEGETCTGGLEGLRTSNGVAISARDMSVGEGINDHPPWQSVPYWILKFKKIKLILIHIFPSWPPFNYYLDIYNKIFHPACHKYCNITILSSKR